MGRDLQEATAMQPRDRTHPPETGRVRAKCPTCDQLWVVAYLPMEIEMVIRLARAARCPRGCAETPVLA